MTIVFGTETARKFDRFEAMPNRTVGVAKLCRHGLRGKEWSRDPVPAGRFDHGVSMILTEMSYRSSFSDTRLQRG
jgi:hypothetical protein